MEKDHVDPANPARTETPDLEVQYVGVVNVIVRFWSTCLLFFHPRRAADEWHDSRKYLDPSLFLVLSYFVSVVVLGTTIKVMSDTRIGPPALGELGGALQQDFRQLHLSMSEILFGAIPPLLLAVTVATVLAGIFGNLRAALAGTGYTGGFTCLAFVGVIAIPLGIQIGFSQLTDRGVGWTVVISTVLILIAALRQLAIIACEFAGVFALGATRHPGRPAFLLMAYAIMASCALVSWYLLRVVTNRQPRYEVTLHELMIHTPTRAEGSLKLSTTPVVHQWHGRKPLRRPIVQGVVTVVIQNNSEATLVLSRARAPIAYLESAITRPYDTGSLLREVDDRVPLRVVEWEEGVNPVMTIRKGESKWLQLEGGIPVSNSHTPEVESQLRIRINVMTELDPMSSEWYGYMIPVVRSRPQGRVADSVARTGRASHP